MNQETHKQYFTKLLLVSAASCAGWLFLVQPAHKKVAEKHQAIESHTNLIRAYDRQVGEVESEDTIEINNRLERIYGAMESVTSEGDAGTEMHNLLNESASQFGVSISRIETVSSREISMKIPESDFQVNGLNHTVRVEFEGEYNSTIGFMDDVVTKKMPVKFTSFRMIPIAFDTVRVNAEIDSVILTSIPAGMQSGGLANDE